MFDVWFLGIPVPPTVGNKLNQLIIDIADKEPSLGVDRKLGSKIMTRHEYHITLGIFHPGLFKTSGSLFKKLFKYLHENSSKVKELQNIFSGTVIINGIGFDSRSIKSSQVVWASIVSPESHIIRERIHKLMGFAGVDESHFQFTDPHISLFSKAGEGDIYDIPKRKKIDLSNYNTEISFNFKQVSLYKQTKIILTFGKNLYNGKPKDKFKTILQAELEKRKPKPQYNWAPLFQLYSHKEAAIIKKIIETDGPRGLMAKGYQPGKIMPLIRMKN